MRRRLFMKSSAAAALAAGLPAAPSLAQEPADFHIAAVLAFSGAYGIIGKDMRQGVEIAVAERQGRVLGKSIRISWEDDETRPQPAVQKATRLLANGAQMIFGAVGSASTPLACRALLTSARCRCWSRFPRTTRSRASAAPATPSARRTRSAWKSACAWSSQKPAALKKIYGVTADYQATRDGWDLFQAEAKKVGIGIVGNDYAPLGNRDFSVIVDKMAKSDADGIAVMITF